MRRILLAAFLLAAAVVATASVALADGEPGVARDPRPHDPFHAPARMPDANEAPASTWSYVAPERLAREFEDVGPGPAPVPAGSGAVRVTAVVLRSVVIVVDPDTGRVTELLTNTPDRQVRHVVFTVRSGSESGDVVELTRDIWQDARPALAHARAGTGTIWSD